MKTKKIKNYSKLMMLRCYKNVFFNLVKAKLAKKKIPFMVEFQITTACNLRCKYCYAALETLKDKPEFSLSEWLKIFDEFYKLGMRVARILGGEPLFRKDIGQMIRHLKGKGVFVELATNGLLIDKHIDDLKLIDILQISIDGDRYATDSVRGDGTYESIIAGIKTAKEHGLPVRIHGVFNKLSIEKGKESPVRHLAELSKKYDVPFNFCQYVCDFDGRKNEAYVPFPVTKPYHEECLKYKKMGYKFFNSYDALNQILNWIDVNKDVLKEEDRNSLPKGFNRCLAGEMYCFLDADGSLYPCVPLWKHGANIREVGIRKAWESLAAIRKSEGCLSCLSLGDIEFSKTMALNHKVLFNTFSKVFMGLR